jgi:glutathione peroxidase
MKSAFTLFVALAAAFTLSAGPASAAKPKPGATPMPGRIYEFKVRTIDGAETTLDAYRGKTLLVVNTASRCGFTKQYESLEALYKKYSARGFEVLAFPANNFMGQEPGTDAEIRTFCSTKYDVTFPLFAKISVRGKDIAPLYAYLTKDSGFPGAIPWNFTKFVVSPEGKVVGRFDPATDPLESKVTDLLETLLPAPQQLKEGSR